MCSDISCGFHFRVSDDQLFMYLFAVSMSNITMKLACPLPSGDWQFLLWNDWMKEASYIRTRVQADWGGGGLRRSSHAGSRREVATSCLRSGTQGFTSLPPTTPEWAHSWNPRLAAEAVVYTGYQITPKCSALKQWQSFAHSPVWQNSVQAARFSSILWAGMTGAGASASRTAQPRGCQRGAQTGLLILSTWASPRAACASPQHGSWTAPARTPRGWGSKHKAVYDLTLELSGCNSMGGIEGIYGYI